MMGRVGKEENRRQQNRMMKAEEGQNLSQEVRVDLRRWCISCHLKGESEPRQWTVLGKALLEGEQFV